MDEWVSLRERNFIKEKIIYSTYIYSIYRLISFLKILMQKKKRYFSRYPVVIVTEEERFSELRVS